MKRIAAYGFIHISLGICIFLFSMIDALAAASAGARATGMANAFVAVADDPSAIWHNPAGIEL